MKWVNLVLISGLLFIMIPEKGQAQQHRLQLEPNPFQVGLYKKSSLSHTFFSDTLSTEESEFPTPRSVLFKSMMVPGWGQIENNQIWKVPIIYGMFAGVGIYTSYLNNRYNDYRAAYYNSHQSEENDFKYGPTPDYLVGINPSQLQSNRNSFRNQRDFMFIVMGLAYGLNVLDAYIFAHMRNFDVSDDLSASTQIGPAILDGGNPGISVRINIY